MKKIENLGGLVTIIVLSLIIISVFSVVISAYNENNSAQPLFTKNEARKEMNEARKDVSLNQMIDDTIKNDVTESYKKDTREDIKKDIMQWEPTEKDLLALHFKRTYVEGCNDSGSAVKKSYCSCTYDYMLKDLGPANFYKFAAEYANGEELTDKQLNLIINSASYCLDNS